MKQQEEQYLADELEQIIQQAQASQPAAATTEIGPEAALAQQLIDVAQKTEADPAFTADLRARLYRQAQQVQRSTKPPEKASFWRRFTQMQKEDNTMKRLLALGAILILFIFVGAAVFNSGLLGTSSEVAEITPMPVATVPENADATTTEGTEVAVLPADQLPPLPRFEAQTGGMGGGGGDGTMAEEAAQDTAVAEPLPVDGDFDMKMMDPFSGTLFSLSATLPVDAATGSVLQRGDETTIDAAYARQIADLYGFTGPLYIETYPPTILENGEVAPAPPPTYIAFDGPRTLRLDNWAINYNNEAAAMGVDYTNITPNPNQAAIAEAFLQERGQLNFPYVMDEQYGYDVLFYRMVDGRQVNEPEITISVNPEGEIMYVYDNTSTDWQDLGVYPLITAEQAWQHVLGGIYENNIQYWMMPANIGEEVMPIETPDYLLDYQYWPRTFTPGNELHLYDWPMVFQPVDGGAPLLKVRQYTLAADEATLNALAQVRDQQIHLWGTLNADNTITLAGWEPMNSLEPIFQQGVVRWQGEQLVFYGQDGSIYILPDAPADIPDGLEVNIFGYATRDTGLEYPLLDWESLDKVIVYPEEPILDMPVDDMPIEPFEPFRYGNVQINAASLVYMVTYSWPEPSDDPTAGWYAMPTVVLQPAWAFEGTADNGDTVKLFVQAVDEAYLQP
jgi:hypothetical protein